MRLDKIGRYVQIATLSDVLIYRAAFLAMIRCKSVHEIRRMQGTAQIAKFLGLTWGPPGVCRPQMGLMLAPGTLQSGQPWVRVGSHYFLLTGPVTWEPLWWRCSRNGPWYAWLPQTWHRPVSDRSTPAPDHLQNTVSCRQYGEGWSGNMVSFKVTSL